MKIQIKPSEFYEKYWVIKDDNGCEIKKPKLSQDEADFLDKHFDSGCKEIYFYSKRRRPLLLNIDLFKKEYKKLPLFLKK